jgi:hypothetical protein
MGIEQQEPSLSEQTVALGKTLKALMEADPAGTPTETAAVVFVEWLEVAGPASKQPAYFADVAENYAVRMNSNRDLFDLFVMLEAYLAEAQEPEPIEMGTFIGLPIAE